MTVQNFEQTCITCSRPTNAQPVCPWCRTEQTCSNRAAPAIAAIPGKTPGVAVLLTFFWLGAGHVYANRTATGAMLALLDLFLLGISLTGVGIFFSLPIWLITTPIAMILAANAAHDFNRRNGIPLH